VIQHKTVLIIFPLILQISIIARMLSIGWRESSCCCCCCCTKAYCDWFVAGASVFLCKWSWSSLAVLAGPVLFCQCWHSLPAHLPHGHIQYCELACSWISAFCISFVLIVHLLLFIKQHEDTWHTAWGCLALQFMKFHLQGLPVKWLWEPS